MLQSQAGVEYSRNSGDIVEVPENEANRMIEGGICEKVIEGTASDLKEKGKSLKAAQAENKVFREATKTYETKIRILQAALEESNKELSKMNNKENANKASKKTGKKKN